MKKILSYFTLFEKIYFISSVLLIVVSFFAFKNKDYINLVSSLVGITALLFVSKGNFIGQIITIIFAILYGIVSLSYKFYGEMITYLFMSAPMALLALISWLKNPYKGDKYDVKVNKISYKEIIIVILVSLPVTVLFYILLKVLNTNNLIVSTLSITTSFLASYFTFRRSKYYALFYAFNDVVLIVLWILACINNISYMPIVICFVCFLASDLYGFYNWNKIYKRQN